jgi:site-specific recombinase XerD
MSKLLDNVRKEIRKRNYSRKTEDAYVMWIKRFILFHNKKHPLEMNEHHIQKFLDYLGVNKVYSPYTQRVALNAIVFLYKHVLHSPLGDFSGYVKAKKTPKIPVVFQKTR